VLTSKEVLCKKNKKLQKKILGYNAVISLDVKTLNIQTDAHKIKHYLIISINNNKINFFSYPFQFMCVSK